MKNLLSILLVFCVLAMYAKTTSTTPINGDPPKKSISNTEKQVEKPEVVNEVKSPTKVAGVGEDLQAAIANCYGISTSDVVVGTPGTYYIISLGHLGYISSQDCGTNCTYCCISVYPIGTPCCFFLMWDYP